MPSPEAERQLVAGARRVLQTFVPDPDEAAQTVTNWLESRPGALAGLRADAQGPANNVFRLLLDLAAATAGDTSGVRARWNAPIGVRAPAEFQRPFADPILNAEAHGLNLVPASAGAIGSLLASMALAPVSRAWQLGRVANYAAGAGAAAIGSSAARGVAGENPWPAPLQWIPRLFSFNPNPSPDNGTSGQ